MQHLQENFFKSSDETSIFYRIAMPAKKVKSIVLLIHGWGEHSGHHEELIRSLNDEGFGVYAPDMRGFGHSQGQRGYISEFADYLYDLYLLIGIIKKIHTETKLFVIGHSMGGLIVTRLVQVYQNDIAFNGLVLSAPLFKLVLDVPKIKIKVGEFFSKWVPRLSLPNKIPVEKLTHDPEKAAEIEQDPLFHWQANSRWFTEVTREMETVVKKANTIKLPILILHSREDEVNSIAGSKIFLKNLENKENKQLKELEGMKHNIFDEVNRKSVFKMVTSWLKKNG